VPARPSGKGRPGTSGPLISGKGEAMESGLLKYLAEERLQAAAPNYAFKRLHCDEILMMLQALLSERNLGDVN